MAKPVHDRATPGPEGMRINKYISRAGVCSRRDADKLVEQGRVRIDGTRVTEHGTRVYPGQRVEVSGRVIRPKGFVYTLLNKPKDTISTTDDAADAASEGARTTVLDVVGVPEGNPEGVFPVGRLDRNTTGVLLITNDGDLAHRLMHPRYEIRKIYRVRTREPIQPHQIDRLQRGIALEDGTARADQAMYYDPAQKEEIALQIHEGRNRQVRRMMEALGHTVVLLERTHYADLTLDGLARGTHRVLKKHEIKRLRHKVKLK
jgi:23S rRNA pseudouridine2605 synthase